LLSSIPQQIQEGINTMSLSELPAELIHRITRTLLLGVSVVALCLGGGARYCGRIPLLLLPTEDMLASTAVFGTSLTTESGK
jgi:hypothetical protein